MIDIKMCTIKCALNKNCLDQLTPNVIVIKKKKKKNVTSSQCEHFK